MSRLRDTLLEIQKEKMLKQLLESDYDNATDDQKEHFYNIVKTQIEIDVDSMLQEYVFTYEASTPVTRKNKKIQWVYIIGNVALGIGSAYAVNEEEWVFAGILGFLMFVNQYLPFVYNKD